MNIDNDIAFPDDVAGALGTSLAPITPSADVRQRILSTISSLPQERSTGLRSVPNLAADGSAHPDNLVPLRSRRTRLIRNLSQVAAAVVLIGAGVGIGRWSTLDSMEHTSNFAELNQAQDVVRISDKMPDGHVVTLMWSEEMKMAAVTMPPELQAPPGHSLEVWLRHGNQIRNAGTYEPSNTGPFSFIDVMPEDGDELFVTIEPEGQSQQPSSEAIITWKIDIRHAPSERASTQSNSSV